MYMFMYRYDKHYYDIHVIDVTADELLKGNASIWDDVIYKLYFVLCHDDDDDGGGGDDGDDDDDDDYGLLSRV